MAAIILACEFSVLTLTGSGGKSLKRAQSPLSLCASALGSLIRYFIRLYRAFWDRELWLIEDYAVI